MTTEYLKRKLHNLLHPITGQVWMLHRLTTQRSIDPSQRALEVTPDWLEQRIADCRRQGFRFVAIDQIGHSRHDIAITFDDGYADNLILGLPLFQRLEVPFTVYITTGFLDNRTAMWWYPGQQLALTTDQLHQLAQSPLCTIGAHTVSHPHLSTLSIEEQSLEIKQSCKQLEQLIDRPIKHFSMPHGDYNESTFAICRQLNLHTAARSWGGPLRRGFCTFPLNRIEIVQP